MTFEELLIIISSATNNGCMEIPFDFFNNIFGDCCELDSNNIFYGDTCETCDDLKYSWGGKRVYLPENVYDGILDKLNNLQYEIRDTDNIGVVEDCMVQQQVLIKKYFQNNPILENMLCLKSETLGFNKINFINGYLNYKHNILPFLNNSNPSPILSTNELYNLSIEDHTYNICMLSLEDIDKDLYEIRINTLRGDREDIK